MKQAAKSPWTDADPQPGDFDAELADTSGWIIERLPPNPDAKVTYTVAIDREDIERLQRISAARGASTHDVLADLIRQADQTAA
jgi:hypothetical protein